MKTFQLTGDIADFDYHSQFCDFVSSRAVKAFVDSLQPGEEATIEINSCGGLVTEGIAMANAIKNSKAHITAHVTGLAASMASVVACACEKLVMNEASFIMIHDPWAIVIGSAKEMRHEASVLDTMKKAILSFYRGKFSGTEDELAKLMEAETWYTGAECKANGFDCEVIASDLKAAASLTGVKFENIPEAARAFATRLDLTDDQKAEIETARKAALEPTAASASPVQPAAASGQPATAPVDWEARYKGASKTINALQAEIATLKAAAPAASAEEVAELRDKLATTIGNLEACRADLETARDDLAAANDRADSLASQNSDLTAQVEQRDAALAEAKASVSSLTATLEQREQDLASVREQLAHANETRSILTGGVLNTAVDPASGKSGRDRAVAALRARRG